MRRLLVAAEHVLTSRGIGESTVAAIAAHAEMSVGSIYRRFSSKEQLLQTVRNQLFTQLEERVTHALRCSSTSGLSAIVGAFARALASTFAGRSRIFPELLVAQHDHGYEGGLEPLIAIQRALVAAVQPRLTEIRRPDPEAAVHMAARTILSSCVHRAATRQFWPDEPTWNTWAAEATEMALAYLTTLPSGNGRDEQPRHHQGPPSTRRHRRPGGRIGP
ncbi:TetR/AcrR family transcriptional regulator [Amycolatopsis lurida]